MKFFIPAVLSMGVIASPALAEGVDRPQAEALVTEAADVLRGSGLDPLVHNINHAGGRFASKDATKPQLILYDLKGKILAFAGDARHIGMQHGKAMAGLLEYAKSTKKGWYEPVVPAGGMKMAIYFEKVGEVLITTTLHMH